MSDKPTCPGDCTAKVAVHESRISDLDRRLIDIDKKLDKILDPTTKTNGSVQTLKSDMLRNFAGDEKLKEEVIELKLQHARAYAYVAGVSGAVGVIGAIIGKLV